MKISQYANATPLGVSSKLIGTNVSANDETANFTISDVLGLGDAYFAPNDYGSFFDSTTQNVTAGQIAAMKYATTVNSNNVSIGLDGSSNPTQITFVNAGVYNIQFSAQLYRTSTITDAKTTIWLRLNGVDVPNSATSITMKSNAGYAVASWNFFQEVTSTQYVEIMWSQDNVISILAEVADVVLPHPAVPSVILTVNRVY
jgi:endonuclease YncB( thermonuclease family)